MNKLFLTGLGVVVGLLVFSKANAGQKALVAAGGLADQAGETLGISNKMTTAEKNRKAFLKMIRVAEGTASLDGYRMLFGGGLFYSFNDHPRKVITRLSNGVPISSSAAGAYQILKATWDALRKQINLQDFSPENQDKAALELIRQKGAIPDIEAGRFDVAINKVRAVWASLPGAGYGQPERKLADLKAVYQSAGGVVA